MKISDFQKIPPYTYNGGYGVNIPLDRVDRALTRYAEEYGLDTDPDFQRNYVWNQQQQIRFVEHVLRDGAMTGLDIYFNCPSWMGSSSSTDPMVLVDGKQRVSAVLLFLRNYIPAYGTYLRDFTGHMRFAAGLKFHVNCLQTRAEVYQWYLDLNAGGTAHTDEELDKVRQLLQATKG